jgi:hypothetical protein
MTACFACRCARMIHRVKCCAANCVVGYRFFFMLSGGMFFCFGKTQGKRQKWYRGPLIFPVFSPFLESTQPLPAPLPLFYSILADRRRWGREARPPLCISSDRVQSDRGLGFATWRISLCRRGVHKRGLRAASGGGWWCCCWR